MKILVCEHLPAEGHANLFVNICKLLIKGGYEVLAVVPLNFTKKISFCDVVKLEMKYYTNEYSHSSSINKIKYSLRAQKYISGLYKNNDISATIVVTYEEISFALGMFAGYIKGPMFVFQNLNPDAILVSKIRRLAYDLIKKRVYSVVLAGFIKDILVSSLHTKPEKVLVLPHPMNHVKNKSITDIDCVGISNSNDESIIEKIIQSEKKDGHIKKNNLIVLLKSKKHKYDNGYLRIISGFIESSIYDDYIARAKCILIPFPNSFRSRISGNLIDALSNGKSVIGTNIPVIAKSLKCYGEVIKIYNESSFVNDVIEIGQNNQLKNENYRRFQEQHSDEILSKILSIAVKNAIFNKPMEDVYDF